MRNRKNVTLNGGIAFAAKILVNQFLRRPGLRGDVHSAATCCSKRQVMTRPTADPVSDQHQSCPVILRRERSGPRRMIGEGRAARTQAAPSWPSPFEARSLRYRAPQGDGAMLECLA